MTSVVSSSNQITNNSIPQGSVLGCILFLLYINDLPNVLYHKCILYADDITTVIKCSNREDLEIQLQLFFDQITNWLSDHNLMLNVSKTKLIQIITSSKKKALNIEYVYNNNQIATVSSCSLLGVEIDSGQNWNAP